MSIHIEIWKVFEDEHLVTYAFGLYNLFRKKAKGKVIIIKETGDVNIVECIDKSVSEDAYYNFYLPRLKTVLTEHHHNDVYPDRTDYPTLREK